MQNVFQKRRILFPQFAFRLRSGDASIERVDEEEGNTGEVGRWFFRVEDHQGDSAREKCFAWYQWHAGIRWQLLGELSKLEPCPCQLWQAWRDGRFWLDFHTFCASSRDRSIRMRNDDYVYLYQQCCYSTKRRSWGALLLGPPDGGFGNVLFLYRSNGSYPLYTDSEAYQYCCVQSTECERFYQMRPSRSCFGYRPPPRSKSSSLHTIPQFGRVWQQSFPLIHFCISPQSSWASKGGKTKHLSNGFLRYTCYNTNEVRRKASRSIHATCLSFSCSPSLLPPRLLQDGGTAIHILSLWTTKTTRSTALEST